MRTERQIEASRENGGKSRGPISDEGKTASARNGITHGLSGGHKFLYKNEPDGPYNELHAQYTEMLQPANGVERNLVDQLVSAAWRMQRIDGIEAGIINLELDGQKYFISERFKNCGPDDRMALAFGSPGASASMGLAGRYLARARRCYDSAYKILREVQRDRVKREGLASPTSTTPATPRATTSTTPTEPRPTGSGALLPSEPKTAQSPLGPRANVIYLTPTEHPVLQRPNDKMKQ
jgi:hypothetical protein